MTDLDALLLAVADNPAEDTPRLMYADALDERGWKGDRERAEFVRVQVEIAAMVRSDPLGYNDSRSKFAHRLHHELQPREKELLEVMVPREMSHQKDRRTGPRATQGRYYFAECGCPLAGFSLRRGFLEQITVSSDSFMAHAAEIFTRHPVERVTLVGKRPVDNFIQMQPGEVYWEFTDDDIPLGEYWILPESMLEFMTNPSRTTSRGTSPYRNPQFVYSNANDGRRAINDCCVAFGRAAAANARLGDAVAI